MSTEQLDPTQWALLILTGDLMSESPSVDELLPFLNVATVLAKRQVPCVGPDPTNTLNEADLTAWNVYLGWQLAELYRGTPAGQVLAASASSFIKSVKTGPVETTFGDASGGLPETTDGWQAFAMEMKNSISCVAKHLATQGSGVSGMLGGNLVGRGRAQERQAGGRCGCNGFGYGVTRRGY